MIDRKYLIFDLGGVLLDIFPPATAEALAALGVREEHITDGLTLENPLLHSIECGNSTREELFAAIAESMGRELTPSLAEEIRAAWCALLGAAPAWKFARLRALREKGYKIFLLSNTNAIHWETITKIVAAAEGKQLEEYFDGVYLSFEMHCCNFRATASGRGHCSRRGSFLRRFVRELQCSRFNRHRESSDGAQRQLARLVELSTLF